MKRVNRLQELMSWIRKLDPWAGHQLLARSGWMYFRRQFRFYKNNYTIVLKNSLQELSIMVGGYKYNLFGFPIYITSFSFLR